jgi:putative sigma-54 modulation protein
MKISYRGMDQQLAPKLQGKLDAKFGKLSKLLEKRGEKEAHVVLTTQRHLHHAEITLQFYDHKLVGDGSDTDVFTSMSMALDKLEKQAVSQRGKWREKTRRHNGDEFAEALAPETKIARVKLGQTAAKPAPPKAAAPANGVSSKRVFRVNHLNRRKPMTIDEAVIEMENGREYVVYRDADRECLSVLVRRRDGNFDLIES